MKNKTGYIILGLIICIFTFSILALNDNSNENTIVTSSIALSNKKIGWGIKRAEGHIVGNQFPTMVMYNI